MSIQSFEIRICESCGLRYPLANEQKFGTRCPHCLGETRLVSGHKLDGDASSVRRRSSNQNLAVLLDNIRSAWNVGSILRSADGFGFIHAYLCGITPTPELEAVQKTALGADEYVTWSHHKDSIRLTKGLKKEGWRIWALEESEHAEKLPTPDFDSNQLNTVLILGSEVTGVDPELLDLCDKIYYIPMRGRKRSFNVAVAFGIAAFMIDAQSLG